MNYIKIYTDFLRKKLTPQKKMKVIFDCSNGTTSIILNELLKTNTLNYKLINQTSDGNFPAHGPNPLMPGALNNLQSAVIKNKADLGIIFDADGDRVFFIDNLGKFIDPDIITRLLIWHLQPKKIVIDVRTGWLVKKLKTDGLQLITSQVGHYFIKKIMRENNANFGAEKSGHYYFPISCKKEISYIDSGILAAIEVINALSKIPYSLNDFNNLLPQYYRSGEININITKRDFNANLTRKQLFEKIEKKITAEYSKLMPHISYLDGLTIESKDFWLNLRFSNTEQILRLNIETNNSALFDKITKKIYYLIRS